MTDFRQMREAFDSVYSGRGMQYFCAYANEVVTKGMCIFRMTGGDPREAIVASVNFGRDTDCLAAVSAGISGALSGASAIPAEWISQVDYATSVNPYTNSQRTVREHSDGLYAAFWNRLEKCEKHAATMRY